MTAMAVAWGAAREGAHRWRARPFAAAAVRAAAIVLPWTIGFAAVLLVVSLFPRPRTWSAWLGVWLCAMGASAAAIAVSLGVTRRLMPLSTLLAVSLAFPDHVPSRMGVALRAGAPNRLLERDADHRHRPESDAARVLALAAGLTAHDRATRGHSERVRAYSELIADELGLDETAHDRLRWAALLHDVGKVTVPATTLNATHPLSADEWAVLRRHPEEGAALAAPLAGWLGEWTAAIAQHHERFDGTGYPRGLTGDELALAGRIVCVADSFDAMTAERSYTKPVSLTEARRRLVEQAGGQFDPEVVRAFLNVGIGRLRRVLGVAAFAAAAPMLIPLTRAARRAPASVAVGAGALIAAVSLVVTAPGSHGGRAPIAAGAAAAEVGATATPASVGVTGAAVDGAVSTASSSSAGPRLASATPVVSLAALRPAGAPRPPDQRGPVSGPTPRPAPPPCQADVGLACAGYAVGPSPGVVPVGVMAHVEVRPTGTGITIGQPS